MPQTRRNRIILCKCFLRLTNFRLCYCNTLNHYIFNERPECQDRLISFLQKWDIHTFQGVKPNKKDVVFPM